MKITVKQEHALRNLHRIVLGRSGRKIRATLDGEDCRYQLVSLGARSIIRWDGRTRPIQIAEPEGIIAHMGRIRYQMAGE